MGMSHRDRFVASMSRVAIVGAGGALVAVLITFLLSPVAPIGPARLAETSPGFAADWWVLLLGGLSVAIVTCAVGLWPAWRNSRVFAAADEPRPSRVSARLASGGASIAATTGVRFALEPGLEVAAHPGALHDDHRGHRGRRGHRRDHVRLVDRPPRRHAASLRISRHVHRHEPERGSLSRHRHARRCCRAIPR